MLRPGSTADITAGANSDAGLTQPQLLAFAIGVALMLLADLISSAER